MNKKSFLKDNIIFISSSGGHLSELLQMKELFHIYSSILVTEKDFSSENLHIDGLKDIIYLNEARRDNMLSFCWSNIRNLFRSIVIYFRVRPKVIVTTGANTAVYMAIFSKIFKTKLIFIETMAAIDEKSITGNILYRFADSFFIQWQSLQELYPSAEYIGNIY